MEHLHVADRSIHEIEHDHALIDGKDHILVVAFVGPSANRSGSGVEGCAEVIVAPATAPEREARQLGDEIFFSVEPQRGDHLVGELGEQLRHEWASVAGHAPRVTALVRTELPVRMRCGWWGHSSNSLGKTAKVGLLGTVLVCIWGVGALSVLIWMLGPLRDEHRWWPFRFDLAIHPVMLALCAAWPVTVVVARRRRTKLSLSVWSLAKQVAATISRTDLQSTNVDARLAQQHPRLVNWFESPWVWWRLGLLVSNPEWGGLLGSIERCFELCGRDVAAVAVEAVFVEPVHP